MGEVMTILPHYKLRQNLFQKLNTDLINVSRISLQRYVRTVYVSRSSLRISIVKLIRFYKDIHVRDNPLGTICKLLTC